MLRPHLGHVVALAALFSLAHSTPAGPVPPRPSGALVQPKAPPPRPAPKAAPLRGPGAPVIIDGSSVCGNVSRFFGQTPQDWIAARTDQWLDRWWVDNQASFKYRSGGFAAVFGQQYMGNPDWSCKMDGSASNCDYNPCQDSAMLETAGLSTEPAYYVIESINRMHAYFKGLSGALQVSGIFSALQTGAWVETFWMSPKRGDAVLARLGAIAAITILAVASAAFAVVNPALSAVLAGVSAMFYGAYAAGMSLMKAP